ncbi:MAG: acetolactate synthase large subunit, partial [Halioglobus sp.]|nr:acetolactate synthase large subunit [Halioglobus sp.]
DDAYGMIKWKQAHMQFADFGLDYGNPDFVRYAESYGARGWRIGSEIELLQTLEHCLDEHAVHVIDLPIDYSLNEQTLNHTLVALSEAL